MADGKNTAAVPLQVAALHCGVKVGGGLLATLAVGGFVALTIDQWSAIVMAWAALLRAASLGGESFWFAVSGGIAAMATAAWGVCINVRCGAELSKAINVVGALTCIIVWFIFFRAATNTFGDLADLSPYKAVGFAFICVPWLALILCVMAVLGIMLNDIGFGAD